MNLDKTCYTSWSVSTEIEEEIVGFLNKLDLGMEEVNEELYKQKIASDSSSAYFGRHF